MRRRLARDPAAYVLSLALVVLLGVLFSHDERISSDGIDHYVFLRSLAVDHDLDLANDYAIVSPRGASPAPPTPIGRTGNTHPIGPALLWSPFYLAADLVTRLQGHPADGWNPVYRNAVAVGSVCYGWLGLVFVYLLARGEGRGPALLAALGLGFGTFLVWYLAFAPTMAHAMSFGAAAAFTWAWLRSELRGPRRALVLGAALGVAALTRWSSVLLVLLPALEALPRLRHRHEWRSLTLEAAAGAATFFIVFSPQLIVWHFLYGSAVTIPQGGGFLAGAPAWSGVLFSPHHGLFSWSPLLYLGAVGLLLFVRRQPLQGLAALVFLVVLTRLNAGVADWWAGAGFGGRRFDAALPLFGLGLAVAAAGMASLARRRPLVLPLLGVAAFVAWNLAVATHYRSGAWTYAGPVTFEEMGRGAVSVVDRTFGSPFSLPGAVYERLRSGRPLADYESLFVDRTYGRLKIRMGLNESLFLEDGWSPLETDGQVSWRRPLQRGAQILVPLHRAADSVFGLRLRSDASIRCRLVVNQRVLGSCEVGTEWRDCLFDVPAEQLRAGPNVVRVRRLGTGELAVAGAWIEVAPTKN